VPADIRHPTGVGWPPRGALSEDECQARADQHHADRPAEALLADGGVDVAADVHGDGHDGQAGGDQDEDLLGVEAGGGVADDEEDGGDGGAEGALVEAADVQVNNVERPAGAEQGADEAAETAGPVSVSMSRTATTPKDS
jgi:hypothetical protein